MLSEKTFHAKMASVRIEPFMFYGTGQLSNVTGKWLDGQGSISPIVSKFSSLPARAGFRSA